MAEVCARRYFLHSFAFQLEDESAYDVLAQKRLTFWNAWAGQLADDGISEAIRHFKKHRVWRQDLNEWLKSRAQVWVKDSWAWRKATVARAALPDVATQPIDAYYFGLVPDKTAHLQVLEKARTAVRNWYASDLPGRIEANPSGIQIRDAGEFPYAFHDEVPVYASYDFMLKTPERLTIFDWKTGAYNLEKEQKAIDQLHWYALFAIEKWGYRFDQIRLAPVFLSANCGYDETIPDENRLKEIRRDWKARHTEYKSLIAQSPAIATLQESFPMTENIGECASCVFRSCPGYARIGDRPLRNPVKFAVRGEMD